MPAFSAIHPAVAPNKLAFSAVLTYIITLEIAL
jgi:hypothetical protein